MRKRLGLVIGVTTVFMFFVVPIVVSSAGALTSTEALDGLRVAIEGIVDALVAYFETLGGA